MSGQEALKACPFCGAADHVESYRPGESGPGQLLWQVQCIAGGCANPIVEGDTEAEAIEAWNTRASGWQAGEQSVSAELVVKVARALAAAHDEMEKASHAITAYDGCVGTALTYWNNLACAAALALVPTPPQADGGETRHD